MRQHHPTCFSINFFLGIFKVWSLLGPQFGLLGMAAGTPTLNEGIKYSFHQPVDRSREEVQGPFHNVTNLQWLQLHLQTSRRPSSCLLALPALSPRSLHHEAIFLVTFLESVPARNGYSFTSRRLMKVCPEGC